jgi:hypothetical protein
MPGEPENQSDQDTLESQTSTNTGDGPVGQGDYVVQQGECVGSIAYEHGFFWETIWDLAENAELKRTRKNPNVLLPGDLLTIPARRVKDESGGTEQRHQFRRKGVPETLTIVFLDRQNKPRAGVNYKIVIDGDARQGTTDSQGTVRESIPPGSLHGQLILGDAPNEERFDLELGHLDPVKDLGGVQMRLQNLGYDCGSIDGQETPEFVEALEKFQSDQKLQVTGEVDEATCNKLEALHRC